MVPATALKFSRLVLLPPLWSSSATGVSAFTAAPVYTASTVSKSLPTVLTVTPPEAGAVQVHHTELVAAEPACAGSPAWADAPELRPVVRAFAPLSTRALAKLSFAGAELPPTSERFNTTSPDAPPKPSTAI